MESVLEIVGEDEKILDIASADVNNDDHKEIVLLISRSPYYYIRILSAGGEFINEFSLQGVSSPTRTAGKIELYANNNNDDFITVPVYNTNKKETTFLKYNIFGEKVDEFVYRGSVLGWDVLGSGDSIAVAVKNKTDLVLKNIDWAGNEMSKINIGKANSVDDLKTGIDPQTGLSKVFVIYRQNASVLQTSTDFHNGSKKTVGIIGKNKEKWHLLVGSFDKGDYLGVLRFQLSGGPFPLLREDGTWQKNVSMPKIIGGVE